MKLIIIDNYDSFTYNLLQYFGELRQELAEDLELLVFRNDQVDLETLTAHHPDYLVVSPGPCTPEASGISKTAIRYFSGKIPVLGVCLGHQCIAEVFGGKVVRAPAPAHGKMGTIRHDGTGLFAGVENPLAVVRYHSLVVDEASLPKELQVTAVLDDEPALIMGVKHREFPTYGVQFHPESVFTEAGRQVLANFLRV